MTKPEIELSDLYLNLSVETGTSFDGSFIIYSKNGQELEGKVLSTNDKIVVRESKIEGTECEISFYFKGKMAIAGEEHFGDFLLITNGGEYNIPYCITVIPKKLRVLDRELSDLNEFKAFAKENWEKAKEIFFTKEFHDVFFDSKDEYHDLYHGLLKGQSKDVILDNFLMEAVEKKQARIAVQDGSIKISKSMSKSVHVSLQGWGYLEGRVYSQNGNLNISRDSFQIFDFDNDDLEIEISLKEGKFQDTLILETVYQTVSIEVKEEIVSGFRLPASLKRKKEIIPVLLRRYVELRTGLISVDDYISRSLEVLPERGSFYELYRLQLAIIESRANGTDDDISVKTLAEEIEGKRTIYLNDSVCRSYYYYLMSLYKRDRASLMEASIQIYDTYKKTQNFYDYLCLLMVDKKHALDFKEQCERFRDYLNQGENSPLLYLNLLDVLNREPYYLENFLGHRSELISWGINHGYLSLELSKQFAELVLKEKYFSRRHLDILLRLYELKQDDIYLKSICSLFIKGNKTDVKYHKYFEDALTRNLKIVGLNEYYLRTLDYSKYPELPKSLLYYFHYSNSLDKREKAYLYANILYNKEKYEDILPNYMIRMEEFVREQMMEGRMNRYLRCLYMQLIPDILKSNKEMVKYLPNIIFKKKLICKNRTIEGVYVCHDERDEVYIPMVDGVCQIEIYSDSVDLYFVDGKANRYHYGIEYFIEPYLEEEQYRDLCMKYNGKNNKVVLKWMDPLEKGRISYMFQDGDGVRGWRREKAVERILNSHYEEKAMEELSECLDQINYRIINPAYRRTLMNYYMACNRMEDAYFGAELYGSDLMDASQLYLLTCVGLYLHKEEKDDLLLVMAHRSFMGGKYNKDILLYLRKHFEGRNFDLMALWKVLKREGLDTVDYEERLLSQMLFTGERDESMLDVLLSYLEKRENDDLTVSMLEIYSIYYFMGRKNVSESYFAILDKQIKRENGLSFMSRLSYLLRKAEVGYDLEEKEYIRELVEQLCRKHIVFDFYEKFLDFVDMSPMLKEATSFYFYGEDKMDVNLALVLENQNGEERREYIEMEEVCPGFYYGRTLVMFDEKIKEKYLMNRGEEIYYKLVVNKMNVSVQGSRYDLLGRMNEQKECGGKMMKQYENTLSRIHEQIRMIT